MIRARMRLGFAVVAIIGANALGQPEPAGAPLSDRIDLLEERLGALTPASPHLYLELGEEVAAQASDDESRDLARRLFVLALSTGLDTSDRSVAGGACLALALLAESERERLWFEALARNADDRVRAARPEDAALPTRADLDASEVLARIRAGSGRIGRRLLEDPEIRAALAAHAPDAWIGRLEAEAKNWPCPECRNDRFVQDKDRPGERQLCSTCAGNPGPAYTRGELLEHLRIEAALIGVGTDAWSAQLAMGRTAPLREAEPREVAAFYAIDPSRACWRDGRWVACADGAVAP